MLSISEKRELEFHRFAEELLTQAMEGDFYKVTEVAKRIRLMTIEDTLNQNIGTKKKKELQAERVRLTETLNTL